MNTIYGSQEENQYIGIANFSNDNVKTNDSNTFFFQFPEDSSRIEFYGKIGFIICKKFTGDTIYKYELNAGLKEIYHYIYKNKYYRVIRFWLMNLFKLCSPETIQISNIYISKYQITNDSLKLIKEEDIGDITYLIDKKDSIPSNRMKVDFKSDTAYFYGDNGLFKIINLNNLEEIKK